MFWILGSDTVALEFDALSAVARVDVRRAAALSMSKVTFSFKAKASTSMTISVAREESPARRLSKRLLIPSLRMPSPSNRMSMNASSIRSAMLQVKSMNALAGNQEQDPTAQSTARA